MRVYRAIKRKMYFKFTRMDVFLIVIVLFHIYPLNSIRYVDRYYLQERR